jgi:hypothetical protein
VLLILALGLLTLAFPAAAQGPVLPQHSDPTWQATYWNNTSLSGSPALQRSETNIDHEWGANAPAAGVNADYFSARWTRYIDVTPGTYRFTVTSDDGMRVWVDNNLIIDEWNVHPPTSFTADVYMGEGHHLIKVEYFEEAGLAVAQVQWRLKDETPSVGNWKAEYYNNLTLSGSPVLSRNESAINYDWGSNSPKPGVVSADNFSVRWTQTLNLASDAYTFWLTVDDGARLWVNGHLLVDAWFDQAAKTYSDSIFLPGGPVTIEVQYYERGGSAVAKLSWSGDNGSQPPSGDTVIVDDTDSGFVKGGAARSWRTAAEGYDGRLLWTYNNASVSYNYNWGRWYPDLASGRYEVFVYIPYRYTTTSHARYWVSHADGYTLRVVSQSANGDRWVSLGTYRFSGSDTEYVSLSDVTYEPYGSRLIAFDAVKWEKR